MINGVDLFSGYGGLTLALSPWVKPLLYCEIAPYAQGILLTRMASGQLPEAPIFTDITKLDADSIEAALSFHVEEKFMAGRLRKLSNDQVLEAVKGYEAGFALADLAHVYRVTRQTMWGLLKGRTAMRPQQRYGSESHFYRGGSRADERAHDIVETAIRAGRLVNPGQCETCGQSRVFEDGRTGIHAHHDDYNEPLSVRWLCYPCHHKWHQHNEPVPLRKGGAEESSSVDIIYGGFP
ncbi:MAG TPA: hypothetical protein VE954_25705 [Oligoflexus sp.]|uniref:hypothetical protein n=1 Tax=Oligoflexus sp. TaxID=1971216 RepID=UPI002D2F70B9|nr:hypothetical protein [Oligoflexus sp.]HYX36518.1 hypothetical protein [Oligoflexus sp.]